MNMETGLGDIRIADRAAASKRRCQQVPGGNEEGGGGEGHGQSVYGWVSYSNLLHYTAMCFNMPCHAILYYTILLTVSCCTVVAYAIRYDAMHHG